MAPTDSLQAEFARFCGEIAESLSFNRSVGQIYGILYITSQPLSLDEIAKRLQMSKGNASINVRTLEAWGAIRSVWVNGSRRDHYEAHRDIKTIFLKRVQEGVGRRLDMAEAKLGDFHRRVEATLVDATLKQRVGELKRDVSKARKLLRTLAKGMAFLA